MRKIIYIAYTCDVWQSYHSREVLGYFKRKRKAAKALRNDAKKTNERFVNVYPEGEKTMFEPTSKDWLGIVEPVEVR